MGKGSRQLKNTRQLGIEGFFTQMIKLEEYMVAILTTAAAFKNLQYHRAGNHITASQILSIGGITLHKAIAILIN